MNTNKPRPVFLNLFQIRLPVGGVLSILHRVTGILLVLALPCLPLLLQQSLGSSQDYDRTGAWLGSTPGRVAVLVLLIVFFQHLLSGLRHLLLDVHIGLSRTRARASAWAVFVGSGLLAGLMAIWLL
jgi:succinate dehydrogenase / fumarate reductase cytochrome b subunit